MAMRMNSLIDPKQRKKVLEAIEKGDGTLLKKKIRETKPLVEQPETQKSLTPEEQGKLNQALYAAALDGDNQKVNDLIKKGVDVNSKERCNGGRTPLMAASINDRTQTAELLIQNGANVNAGNKYGKTPLMYASENGHTQTAELLIQNGADVNAKDIDGSTPLNYAFEKGNAQTIELLRKHGAKE